MLQNKIYQNFIKEILKTFIVVLFGLSIIAWTVRAVNFLDLIVESGYSLTTYFEYSLLNIFGVLTKFIPLSFLISLMIFVVRQSKENEFVILWTSGVQKIKMVNLFFIVSLGILIFYLIFSTILTPLALNKSRLLLGKDGFNSFLPTIRIQQFSDSFKGFTFLVEKKFNNKIHNVFIHDESNVLKNLTNNSDETDSMTITAKSGLVKEKQMLLFDGQIISTKKSNQENSIIKFEQLNVGLDNLQSDTIKLPKLQETSTASLLKCSFKYDDSENLKCEQNTRKEIITVLNRRIVLPFYIPLISLLCSFLLIKNQNKKNYFLNKYTIFGYCFLVLLYAELILRYTGLYKQISNLFIISPIILMPLIYLTLIYKFKREFLK
jgi:lipopolysaccharide export system permease protein